MLQYPLLFQLLVSVTAVLLVLASYFSIRLIRRSAYNVSWILMSVALVLLAAETLILLIPLFNPAFALRAQIVAGWLGLFVALFFAIGTGLIRQIFRTIADSEADRRNAEKRILGIIIQTEERERRHFAKELHDGLGPMLSAVRMQLSSIRRHSADERTLSAVSRTEQLIVSSIHTAREISNRLSPHILENFGLLRALQSYIEPLAATGEVAFSLHSNLDASDSPEGDALPSDRRFPSSVEVILYRVACELVNNAVRHSHATRIDVELTCYAERLTLVVSDNGSGFDAESLTATYRGMGLRNIRSRIETLGGMFHIGSTERLGTKAIIIVPVTQSPS